MNTRFTAIYVLCPIGVNTGGPEALHQLVDALRSNGLRAYIVPIPGTETATPVERFEKYDAPRADLIPDEQHTAVVAAEYNFRLLKRFKNATIFCWWLSIDNSPLFQTQRRLEVLWPEERTRATSKPVLRAREAVRRIKSVLRGDERIISRAVHLAQSHYAWAYLYRRRGIDAAMLSDYIGEPGAPESESISTRDRARIVCYNPKKSAAIMKHVIRQSDNCVFVPLEKMSGDAVRAQFRKSAIYIDLGYHPGKDRMPREAALGGAVVLVAARGSGAFDQDVPIPDEHKISPAGNVVENAVSAVNAALTDLEHFQSAQENFRTGIARERSTFHAEVRAIFVEDRITRGS